MEKKVHLKRESVYAEESKELWGAYRWFDILSEDEINEYKHDDLDLDIHVENDIPFVSEAYDISISLMKEFIEKAENAGSNYVKIDWDGHHQTYHVSGSKISRMTDDEIKEKEKIKRIRKKMQISGEISGLEYKIKQLKKKHNL